METTLGTPATANLFWHYLIHIFIYTGLIVALMYGVTHYLKRNPGKLNTLRNSSSKNLNPILAMLGKGRPQKSATNQPSEGMLEVEATLALEPEKTLYLVRCGTQRFLLASTPGGLTKIATSGDDEENLSPPSITHLDDIQSRHVNITTHSKPYEVH